MSGASGVPYAPQGLSEKSARFWREIVAEHTLRPDELLVLERVCRTVDTLARVDAALVGVDLVVAASHGGTREHPLVAEQRQQSAALARLLKQLGIPDEDVALSADRRSQAGRALARQRWGSGGRTV